MLYSSNYNISMSPMWHRAVANVNGDSRPLATRYAAEVARANAHAQGTSENAEPRLEVADGYEGPRSGQG